MKNIIINQSDNLLEITCKPFEFSKNLILLIIYYLASISYIIKVSIRVINIHWAFAVIAFPMLIFAFFSFKELINYLFETQILQVSTTSLILKKKRIFGDKITTFENATIEKSQPIKIYFLEKYLNHYLISKDKSKKEYFRLAIVANYLKTNFFDNTTEEEQDIVINEIKAFKQNKETV